MSGSPLLAAEASSLVPSTAPGRPVRAAARPARSFMAELIAETATDPRLDRCIQCGTCGGSCPSASAMDHTPRMLFAMIRAGMREEVLRSSTPWACVGCYFCSVRCPQEVHIPDVMYALKGIAIRDRVSSDRTASDFSTTFVSNIRRFGRSYEVGLVARHYLRHYPLRLPGMTPGAVGMLTSGRMGLVPHRIRDTKGLRAILDRAAELEARA